MPNTGQTLMPLPTPAELAAEQERKLAAEQTFIDAGTHVYHVNTQQHSGGGGLISVNATVDGTALIVKDNDPDVVPTVDDNAVVGPYSHIDAGARICGNAKMGEYSRVGNRAVASGDAQIGNRSTIANRAIVTGTTVIGNRTRISGYVTLDGAKVGDDCDIHSPDEVTYDDSFEFRKGCRIYGPVNEPGNTEHMDNVDVEYTTDGRTIFTPKQTL